MYVFDSMLIALVEHCTVHGMLLPCLLTSSFVYGFADVPYSTKLPRDKTFVVRSPCDYSRKKLCVYIKTSTSTETIIIIWNLCESICSSSKNHKSFGPQTGLFGGSMCPRSASHS